MKLVNYFYSSSKGFGILKDSIQIINLSKLNQKLATVTGRISSEPEILKRVPKADIQRQNYSLLKYG